MLYLLGGVSFLIQIMCVLHVVRTGRNQMWIWIILIGSLLGCTAYFAFEIMPEIFGPGSRFERKARIKADNDVVRRLNAAEAALAKVDSAASRMAMGDAYVDIGAHGEAIEQYRAALDRMNGNDSKIEGKLARALFENGEFAAALTSIDRIPDPVSIAESDRLKLLRARILHELGRREDAAAIYADIVTRLPGAEGNCRYAALLIEMDCPVEARAALESVERLFKERPLIESDTAMIDWARDQLRTLRAAQSGI